MSRKRPCVYESARKGGKGPRKTTRKEVNPMADADLDVGDRYFSTLLRLALEFYLRHKTNIDNSIDSALQTLIMQLVDALPDIIALNPPGPQ